MPIVIDKRNVNRNNRLTVFLKKGFDNEERLCKTTL